MNRKTKQKKAIKKEHVRKGSVFSSLYWMPEDSKQCVQSSQEKELSLGNFRADRLFPTATENMQVCEPPHLAY